MKECDGRENFIGFRKSFVICFGKESLLWFWKFLIYIVDFNDGFGV